MFSLEQALIGSFMFYGTNIEMIDWLILLTEGAYKANELNWTELPTSGRDQEVK